MTPLEFRFAVGIALSAYSIGAASQPAVRIEYATPTSITRREPVVLQTRVKNETGRSIEADFGNGFVSHFEFELIGPGGSRQVARPESGLEGDRSATGGGMEPIGVVSVAPGRTAGFSLVLNRWLDFSVVGDYRLNVRFVGSIRGSQSGSLAPADVAPLLIHVSPPDDAALARACESWAEKASDPDAGTRILASEALAAVKDPVVIPFLVRTALSSNNMFAEREIEALVQLGGPDARKALEEIAKSPNAMVAASARSALARIRLPGF